MITEQEKQFVVNIDDDGHLAFIIKEKKGEPSNPKIMYDGKDHAILIRNAENTVILDYLDDEVKTLMTSGTVVDIVEMKLPDLTEVARGYEATITRMAKLPGLGNDFVTLEDFDKQMNEVFKKIEEKTGQKI